MMLGSKDILTQTATRLLRTKVLPQSSKTFIPAQFFCRKTGYVFMHLRVPSAKLVLQVNLRPSFDPFDPGSSVYEIYHVFQAQYRAIMNTCLHDIRVKLNATIKMMFTHGLGKGLEDD